MKRRPSTLPRLSGIPGLPLLLGATALAGADRPTILSIMFTGCDLLDHVKSQIPLALAAAGLAGLVATVISAVL